MIVLILWELLGLATPAVWQYQTQNAGVGCQTTDEGAKPYQSRNTTAMQPVES